MINFFWDILEKYSKLLIILMLIAILIKVNYFSSNWFLFIKLIVNVFTSFWLFYLLKTTFLLKEIIIFFNKSKIEVASLYWPTVKNTLYLTIIVCIFSILVSCLVWFVDLILLKIISFMTDLR